MAISDPQDTARQTATLYERQLRVFRRFALLSVFGFFVACGVFTLKALLLGPPPLGKANETSVVVLDRKARLLRAFATREGRWRLPVTPDDVDPNYLRMLMAYEDKRFYQHFGVDPAALGRAAWQIIQTGHIVSGGSTLTMQLARLIEGRESRSIKAKVTQIIRAVQIEWRLSKKQILTRYLTLAPFGGNLEGVRSASLAYFGKEPKRLSWSEIALLVALPQAPEVRRPDRFPKVARRARDRVLNRALEAGLLTSKDVRVAKQARVSNVRRAFPMYAAHAAEVEYKKYRHEPVHRLTLDRDLQHRLEKLASDHVRQLGPKLSAAVLVINHETGEVRAHVGSAGYLDGARFGAIDMVRAIRSPGSALKPFIYGLAFEARLAHPESLIEDRPVRFGDYAPENFDKRYRGTVTMREALQQSLNVPAVKVLAGIGPARLAARFEAGGLKIAVPRNLTVALGGVGLRLDELAGLYAALARGGEHVALRYRLNPALKDNKTVTLNTGDSGKGGPVLSKLASWYVSDILAGTPAPHNADGRGIAYKTGTSYGNRDAWAVGFDGLYTIAVWIGRPDGTATPGLTGLTAAAPLLFDAFVRVGKVRAPLKGAPVGAIRVETARLPKPLIYFRNPSRENARPGVAELPFRIAFPPDRAEFNLFEGGGHERMPLVLKAEGGRLPYTWLANGAVVDTARRRGPAFFTPDGEGFHQFTVIDAAGKVDRVSVRIRAP